jgi:hypothetical protein
MAQYPSDREPRPRHSTAEDTPSEQIGSDARSGASSGEMASNSFADAHRRADDAYRGHRVVDDHHRPIGKITDVIYDEAGVAKWAVVSPGMFRAEHFLPLDNTYLSLEGNLVAPFDKRTVSQSPKAERNHALSPVTERVVEQYYQLAA